VGQKSEQHTVALDIVLKCIPVKLVLSDLNVTHHRCTTTLHARIYYLQLLFNIPLVKYSLLSYLLLSCNSGKISKNNKILI